MGKKACLLDNSEFKCLAPCSKMGMAAHACNPRVGGGDGKILGASRPVSIDERVSSWSSKCLSQSNKTEL